MYVTRLPWTTQDRKRLSTRAGISRREMTSVWRHRLWRHRRHVDFQRRHRHAPSPWRPSRCRRPAWLFGRLRSKSAGCCNARDEHSFKITTYNIPRNYRDYFSGAAKAISPVCVRVYTGVGTITFDLSDVWPRYLAYQFSLTLSRSSSKFKVTGQSSRSQEENVKLEWRVSSYRRLHSIQTVRYGEWPLTSWKIYRLVKRIRKYVSLVVLIWR